MSEFKANRQPTLNMTAARLIGHYDSTFGASGPYCCPQALANVLDHLAQSPTIDSQELRRKAAMLRGEEVE